MRAEHSEIPGFFIAYVSDGVWPEKKKDPRGVAGEGKKPADELSKA